MAGLFDTFSIAKRGLSVQQSSIDVTSHNIANTNTTGYTRQRAVSETTEPYGGNSKFDSCTVGQVGTGAQITSIERIRDSFIDYQVRTQTTTNSSYDIQNTYLQQAISAIDDTSNTGIKSALDAFYSAYQSLANSPEQSSNKTVAISKSQQLAAQINDTYTQLKNIQGNVQSVAGTDVTTVNSTLDQINDLNKQIESVTSLGLTPNDLMDKRDNLIDTVSSKFGITVKSEKNNGISVYSNDISGATSLLVDGTDTTGANCTRFSVNTTTGVISTVNAVTKASNSATPFTPTGGEIGGAIAAQNTIQATMNSLDEFAAGLAYTVNAIQTGETNAANDSSNTTLNANNQPIFVVSGSGSDSGITAANISVNSALTNTPTLLNAGMSATSGEKDGTRALAIADLANVKIDFSTINSSSVSTLTRQSFISSTGLGFTDPNLTASSAGGTTLDDQFTKLNSDLGTEANYINNSLTTSQAQLTSLTNQRTSISGVSLDEEMTNLIQYQHAYQANAKVISTVDQLLDVVINGLKTS